MWTDQISPVYRIFRFSDFVSSENGQVYFVNDVGFSTALEFDVLFSARTEKGANPNRT